MNVFNFVLQNKRPSEESSQSSYHLEMPEGVHYCLFLFRRAKRHRPFTGTHVIVLPLPDTKLLLHLSDIGGMDLEAIFLPDISLYIVIGRISKLDAKLLHVKVNANMAIDSLPT